MVCVKLVRWSVHLEVLLLCNLRLPDIGGICYTQIPGRLELKYLMISSHSLSNVFMQSLLWKKIVAPKTNPTHDPEEFWDWKIVSCLPSSCVVIFALYCVASLLKSQSFLWATENSYSQETSSSGRGLPVTLRTKCQVFLDVANLALSVFQPSSHMTSQVGYFALRLSTESQLSLGSLGCLTRSITYLGHFSTCFVSL